MSFTSSQKPGAKGTQPDLTVEVKDPSGKSVELASRGAAGNRIFDFTARQTGAYVLSVDPKGQPVTLNSAEAPLCLYAAQGPFQLVGAAGILYFPVPAGVEQFGMKISAEGGGKIKATIFDAAGYAVCAETTLTSLSTSLPTDRSSRTEVWSLHLEVPTHGACEANEVIFEGLPPLLAASPEALLGKGVPPDAAPPPHVPRLLLIGDSMVSTYLKPPPRAAHAHRLRGPRCWVSS